MTKLLSNNSLHQLRQETKTRHWAIVLEVISGQTSLFNEGSDNRSFESTWERAINERIIYQLGNRREEYTKTILKEGCWYGVQWARFSRRLFDALTDLIFSYRQGWGQCTLYLSTFVLKYIF